MNIIFKNFYQNIIRFKLVSTLNILGLAAAFTVFVVIISQLWWENGYNKNIEDSERIHLMTVDMYQDGNYISHVNRPFGEAVGVLVPEVELYSSIKEISSTAKSLGDNREVLLDLARVHPSFVELFQLETVEGDLSRIQEVNKALIPESLALKFFKGESALGKTIVWPSNPERVSEIVGVYKDLPENSHIKNTVLEDIGDSNINSMSEWSYSYFYKLVKNTSLEHFKTSVISALVKDGIFDEEAASSFAESVKFPNLNELYFDGSYRDKGNKVLSLSLLAVAIIIVLIAAINYINLFMALVPIRIRSVNISKIFGASVVELRRAIVFEGIGVALLGFLLALPMIQLASNMDIAGFTPASLKIADNLEVLGLTAVIAIAIGLISGTFPSYYITSFSPALVLKGSFGRSAKGRTLRAVLTTIQFVVTISLIILSSFIMLQTQYMKNYDYGFDRENLISLNLGWNSAEGAKAVDTELLKNPQIISIAHSDDNVFFAAMNWGRTNPNTGERMNFLSLPVSWNYPELMGLELVEGRFFMEEDSSKPGGTAIFNEAAVNKYGLKIGDKFGGHSGENLAEVVGIVKNFNFRSLSESIEPICLYEFGSAGWRFPSTMNIKVTKDADLKEIGDCIRSTFKKIDPNSMVDNLTVNYLNSSLTKLYQKETRMSKVINLFSMISILISLLGLFGIIVFENQYKRKEVSLRKIHGSTTGEILAMFTSQILRVLALSAVISVPLGWYITNRWLSAYAYKIPIYWWVFVLAILMVAAIVIIVVVSQTFMTARENPVNNLRDY